MISVDKVYKYFGSLQALNNVGFSIDRGEIVGFLGKNGSGKTTLMRILTTYLRADTGKVTIEGKDIVKFSFYARSRIGYLPENPPLYLNASVREYLKLAAELKDIPVKNQRLQIDKALSECQLTEVKDKTIANLSKGYKQRIGIAQAIINDPEILILDEPTNGLDPEQVQHVRKLIKSFEHKRIVILSTHILSEIELLAKRIVMINQGKIVADDFLPHLLVDAARVRKKMKIVVKGLWPLIEQGLRELPETNILNVSSDDSIHTLNIETALSLEGNSLVEKIVQAKGTVVEIAQENFSLEDIFLRLVAHA